MRADAGPYIAADFVRACSGVLLSGDSGARFGGICTDSREIKENDLFVPLKGPNFDGHEFILPALEAGARGSLVACDINRVLPSHLSNSVLIQVQDTLLALSDLASAYRKFHTLPLIAVTGSSGKTSVKEMIAAVLGRSHHPLVSKGNLNNMIGLPMTVLNLRPDHTVAVVEAGINRPGEMEHLAIAASPDVAVITTIGPVHLEGLGTLANVAREKFELVRHLPPTGTAVLPSENPYLQPLVSQAPCHAVFFGIDNGEYRASNLQFNDETLFDMITPVVTQKIRLRVPGRHNIANALAAAAACLAVGVSLSDVADGLSEFTPPSWRMEIMSLPGARILIRDCYNANPQSVTAALEVLAQRGRGRKSLAFLADMMELGPDSEKLHYEVGKKAALMSIDSVIFVGSFGGSFQEGFVAGGGDRGRVTWTRDKDQAWKIAKPMLKDFGVALVKGSRAMKMETIADLILQER